MATVRLGFSPAPAHVRTARLVAVAVARRAGVAEGLFDELRLAVGEACSRAVALHRRHGCSQLIVVEMDDAVTTRTPTAEPPPEPDRGRRFVVRVIDHAPPEARSREQLTDPMSLVGVGLTGPAEPTSPQARAEAAQFAEEAVAAGVGLALLAGLVDDLDVSPTADGTATVVRMSWPIP